VPLGLLLPKQTMSYANLLAATRNPAGKIMVLVVISLFLFHGCHRMVHSLHDLGLPVGSGAKSWFYGAATLATILTASLLLIIGF
jgi:fumarate reductase subunit D